MKKYISLFMMVLLILMTFSLTACNSGGTDETAGAAADDTVYTLKMSTQLNETHPMVEGFKAWAAAVSERTEGHIVIEVYPSAQLGSDEDVIEQAVQGVNVAVLTDGGRMANYVSNMGIIGMPYLADNYDELKAITETDTWASWCDQLSEENGIHVLAFNWYDGPRHFLTNVPVKSPSDLKGLRIRTPGADVWSKSVAAMGGTPVAMGWTEVYNAMQSKAIDGCEAQHTASYGARLYEVLKYINKTGHFQLANGIIVGDKWLSTLPEEYQTILKEECVLAGAENAKLIESKADEFEKMMVDAGMTVVEPDVDAFKAAAEKAYDELGYADLRNQIYEEIGK